MYIDLVASEFNFILSHPDFHLVWVKPYKNRSGRPGMRWEGRLQERSVYVSESQTQITTPPPTLARIVWKRETQFDKTKDPIYFAPKRIGTGIRVEFRYRGRWYEIWSPDF